MSKVLITGATGFLGSALLNHLYRKEFQVRALVHSSSRPSSFMPGVEMVSGDIGDRQQVMKAIAGCSAVVHLAAKVHAIDDSGSEHDYQTVNVEGTRQILDAAVSSGTKHVVFASSVKVFGEAMDGCIDESQAPAPQTPYGQSKWQAEQLVSEYAGRYDLTAVSLRLPMVYGPTKKGNLYRMIEAIDHGQFPALPRLRAVRSLLHVENFVQAVVRCLQSSNFSHAAYIVADAEPYCVTDLYDWLRAGLGKAPVRWRVPLWMLRGGARCGDVFQVLSKRHMPLTTERLTKLIDGAWFNAAAIARELGYQATRSFKETVPDLIAFYRRVTSV
ncbi:MAG: NAD-dependent epimerase/dehydratase family protein [Nitrospira sp.]|nr:NAD-dependent epimerase/dehydratase family protein [Nitrospira sp.]